MSHLLKEDNPFHIESYDRLKNQLSVHDLIHAIKTEDYRFVVYIVTTSCYLLNHNDPCFSPLHHAAIVGNEHIVHLLLCNGSNPTSTSMNTCLTPLHLAVGCNQVKVVKQLVMKGALLNIQSDIGYTPLHYGAWKDSVEAVHQLLVFGADMHCYSRTGVTPLLCAVMSDSGGVFRLLVDHGSSLTDGSMYSVDVEVIPDTVFDPRYNIEVGFDGSPLHWAILKKNVTMINLLVYAQYRNAYEIPIIAAFDKMRKKYIARLRDYMNTDMGKRKLSIFKGIYRCSSESIFEKHWFDIPTHIVKNNILPFLRPNRVDSIVIVNPCTRNISTSSKISTSSISDDDDDDVSTGSMVNGDIVKDHSEHNQSHEVSFTMKGSHGIKGFPKKNKTNKKRKLYELNDLSYKHTITTTTSDDRGSSSSSSGGVPATSRSIMPPGLESLMQPELAKIFPDGFRPREPIVVTRSSSSIKSNH